MKKKKKNQNCKARVEYLQTITRRQKIYHNVRSDIQLWGPKENPVGHLPASSRHLEEREIYCEYLKAHNSVVENPPANVGDLGLIPPSGRFPGERNGNPLQISYLENTMDRGAWWAAVHGVAKSRTRLSDFTFTFHFPALEKATATHSSVLAWRIPGTGEPGSLQSIGL